jgi:superoxide dismutase, Cu-Zn family
MCRESPITKFPRFEELLMRGKGLTIAVAVLLAACNGDERATPDAAMTDAETPAAGDVATTGETAAEARTVLLNAQGDTVGTATLREVGETVRISVAVSGLPPGEKGIHIHQVGSCEPPSFESAGGHFAPQSRQHGFDNPAGPHAGDLRNLNVGADGTTRQELTTDLVTLRDGPNSLFDADGSALVIHAGPDDYRTDPSGQSGDRIACGVIRR